jgi:hypothetical protein
VARTPNLDFVSPSDVQESWRSKLPPGFLEAARFWRDLWVIGERGHGRVQRDPLPGHDHNQFFKKYKSKLKRAGGYGFPDMAFTHLCWTKWRKLPQQLFHAITERYDLKAYDQLAQVCRSFYKWSHGMLAYDKDLKVKGDERHLYLMFVGVLQGDIYCLTERELVSFFDTMCPCGIDTHSESALKKLRDRTWKTLQHSAKEITRSVRAATPQDKKVVRWRKRTCLLCAKPYHRKADWIR